MRSHDQDAGKNVVHQLLQDGELHKALLDQLDTGIYIVDRDRRILYWNGGAERITGYLAHEVAGQLCHGDLLMHCDATGGVLCGQHCPLLDVMLDSKPRECAVFLRHRAGHRVPVRVRSRPIHDPSGGIIGAVEVFEETLAPARHAIRELRAFGCLDELTLATNRRYGEMSVRQALEALNSFGIPFGWLRIGLDDVEMLDHRYGQGMIDAALKMVSGTLDGNLGSLDVLTRWTRTEFRVEVHYSSRLELAGAAEKLVALVRASALDWWGDRVHAAISIGGATAEHGDSLESLEARVTDVFESCQAGGGNRAAIAHQIGGERNPCSE
jgi:PAS domain S-box-containing protein/diguanylate cyclase (GGDEF)-like protein